MMLYYNINAYTQEYILNGTIRYIPIFYTYVLENNFMETQLRLTGLTNDIMFVKHLGTTKNTIEPEEYRAEFAPNQNVATIYKLLLDQVFRMTVLVSKKGKLSSITLCDFTEKSESDYRELADYIYTFTSKFIVYAVQSSNEKLEILYTVVNDVVGKIQGPVEIEGTIPGKADYDTQVFT